MAQIPMPSTPRVPDAARGSPLRVVATAVLMILTMSTVGLVYCYLTTPAPPTARDAALYPRLPMHPF